MKNEEKINKKILDKQCNPMYFQGVRTIMKSDSNGLQIFGRSWSDGPDVGGLHRFTNTAVPRFDGTGWGGFAGGPINAGQNQRTLEGLRGRTVGVL